MSLPIRTTIEDLEAVCSYFANKPTGATLAEARAVVDKKHLDGRKLTALKSWGLIEDLDGKMKITERGRQCIRNSGSHRNQALCEVVRELKPYLGIIERVFHRQEGTIDATEVAAHWFEHFTSEVSDSDKILNDQAIAFFHLAQGADLGTLTVGRRGMSTRFDFDSEIVHAFVESPTLDVQHDAPPDHTIEVDPPAEILETDGEQHEPATVEADGNRVFITHGKNLKILDQVKELVTLGKFEPVVAMEHETAAKPVPQKVMGDMRNCSAAVIHVSSESVLYDEQGQEVPQVNGNVLIEIGAAMALYGERFVLLVEEGVSLPSNLQGLYECRYKGDELNMTAAFKLLRALNEFGS